ncbi:winged helix DNA-binding domain-containing protein [Streptomyces nitrosporeus]
MSENPGMPITPRALNRSTLARQLLLRREPIGPEEALRRVVALQAQQPASPYIALWNRVEGFDPAVLDRAVRDRRAVRSTLMRLTLHLVHTEDYRPFREAMEPVLRGSRLGDACFRASGLTADDVRALLPGLLRYAEQDRSADELRGMLAELTGAPMESAAWRMLRQYAPLWHAPAGGPWSFGTRQSYAAAAGGFVPRTDPGAAAEGLRTMLLRYLQGFGPATVADMAQFAMVPQNRVRPALQALGDRIERLEGPGGAVLHDLPGAPRPDPGTPAPPRLMAMWDSTLLVYADRSRVIPPAYRKTVIRVNGDVLPTVLVDGYVAGVWRPRGTAVEVGAFHPLPEETWRALEPEARSLAALLAGRDPAAYRRYDHWWTKGIPAAEVRLLAAD